MDKENEIGALNVLYRDDYFIAIDKPSGLLVHRSPIDKHETEFAVQQLRDQIGQHVYPLHRLDRPTSGVLLFALSREVASAIGQEFMQRAVKKQYRAIVRGWLRDAGYIDYALKYKWDKYADAARRQQVPPQPAATYYQSVETFCLPMPVGRYSTARFSLVDLFPVTGRKHQLRRHLVHLRHPIVGDTTHGDGKQNKFLKETFGFQNLALSCTKMSFYHPVLNKQITISAPMNTSMVNLIKHWKRIEIKM